MGAKNRTPDHSLDETLVERAWRFSFFQLVRLLERHAKSAARVGGRGPASDEAVRLRPEASLGFPASDVTGLSLIRSARQCCAALPDHNRFPRLVRLHLPSSFLLQRGNPVGRSGQQQGEGFS